MAAMDALAHTDRRAAAAPAEAIARLVDGMADAAVLRRFAELRRRSETVAAAQAKEKELRRRNGAAAAQAKEKEKGQKEQRSEKAKNEGETKPRKTQRQRRLEKKGKQIPLGSGCRLMKSPVAPAPKAVYNYGENLVILENLQLRSRGQVENCPARSVVPCLVLGLFRIDKKFPPGHS